MSIDKSQMKIEHVDETKEYMHSIVSFELSDEQKERLLISFRQLAQTSNSKDAKNTIYEMTGFTPKVDENLVSDMDLDGYMKWLFEQHGFSKSESTTISKK